MSRSIKKNPVLKYGSTWGYKRRRNYNKRFRMRNKQQIRMGKDPYLMNELVNPYDVHDVVDRFIESRWRSRYRVSKWWRQHMTEDDIIHWKRIFYQK